MLWDELLRSNTLVGNCSVDATRLGCASEESCHLHYFLPKSVVSRRIPKACDARKWYTSYFGPTLMVIFPMDFPHTRLSTTVVAVMDAFKGASNFIIFLNALSRLHCYNRVGHIFQKGYFSIIPRDVLQNIVTDDKKPSCKGHVLTQSSLVFLVSILKKGAGCYIL